MLLIGGAGSFFSGKKQLIMISYTKNKVRNIVYGGLDYEAGWTLCFFAGNAPGL